MYLRLALRNARRSVFDYLLYVSTMVLLTAIIFISNCAANWGNIQAGFQTMSLPLLIVLVMAILVNYTNTFIVKQRAKEFATYMLLGMEKNKLALVFLCELSIMGILCFLGGVLAGAGFCYVFLGMIFQSGGDIWSSVWQTLGYFCFVEILSVFCMRHKIYRLQIIQLMDENRSNQPFEASHMSFWRRMFAGSFLCFLVLLCGISFLSGSVLQAAVSVIAVPVLLCVLSFYKWLYAFLISIRLTQSDVLLQGSRLYRVGEMTTGSKTSAGLNSVFCVCLIFSMSSFVFGFLLLHPGVHVFELTRQHWMGFLQITICIIFLIIYFSVLSLSEMIDLKREARNIRLLFQMGKNPSELKTLLRTQILVKLFLPTMMSFVLLLFAMPFVNHRINTIFPASMQNLLFKAAGIFVLCFCALYIGYFGVLYMVSLRYIRINKYCTMAKTIVQHKFR